MLLLTPKGNDTWEVLVNPGRKALPGVEIEFAENCYCKVLDKTEFGGRLVEFHYDGNFDSLLDQIGEMPTPPYIHKKLGNNDEYQTVYAKYKGSAAAPTAGLHFTPELMEEMKKKGAKLLFVTLHVGIGTFRPVSEENIEDHEMHKEWYTVSEETAKEVNAARAEGRRVIAVGTTLSAHWSPLVRAVSLRAAAAGRSSISIRAISAHGRCHRHEFPPSRIHPRHDDGLLRRP